MAGKNIGKTLLIGALFLAQTALAGSNPCTGLDIPAIKKHVPLPPAKIISKRPIDNVCEIILSINGEMVPIYATQDYVIAGEMFKDHRQITVEELNKLKVKNFSQFKPEIEKNVFAVLKPASGKPKKVVYMFTDPVCPYCHFAESQLINLANKYNAEFKLILFGVHGENSTKKAVEAICRHLTAKEYLKGDWRKEDAEKYQCKAGKEQYKNTILLAQKLGINGVPTFYTEDGQMIVGANIPKLTAVLSKN